MQAVTATTRPAIFPLTGLSMPLLPMFAQRPPKKEEDPASGFGLEVAASMMMPGSEILLEVTDALDEIAQEDNRNISFEMMRAQVAQTFWLKRQAQMHDASMQQRHPEKSSKSKK